MNGGISTPRHRGRCAAGWRPVLGLGWSSREVLLAPGRALLSIGMARAALGRPIYSPRARVLDQPLRFEPDCVIDGSRPVRGFVMTEPDQYVLGYRQAEQERLQQQAQQLAHESSWLFDQIA